MSLKRTIKVPNGDFLMDYRIFECDNCGTEIEEYCPHWNNSKHPPALFIIPCADGQDICGGGSKQEDATIHYCPQCAYERRVISGGEFIYLLGGDGDDDRYYLIEENGKYHIGIGRRARKVKPSKRRAKKSPRSTRLLKNEASGEH